jgi:hypothetical protein
MKHADRVNEADLHLYLAGALPWRKRLILAGALALDAGLRTRLASLRAEAEAYRNLEMTSLRGRLFPAAGPARGAARGGAPAPGGFRWEGFLPSGRPWSQWGPALGGAFAVLALCAAPWLKPAGDMGPGDGAWGGAPDIIAKGNGLGIALYVKGDSAFRVERHAARVSPEDTLQALPLGSAPQHLALFGWDARQGLVRLFPAEGAESRRVAPDAPPPALLTQGMEDNRLVCVTSNAPFRLREAEALLGRPPFRPLDKAPATRLQDGLLVQVFTILKAPAAAKAPARGRI